MAGRLGLALTAILAVAPSFALAVALVVDHALARSGAGRSARYVPIAIPLAALAAVAVVVHRRTGSSIRAAVLTLGALMLCASMLLVVLIVAWSQASGS